MSPSADNVQPVVAHLLTGAAARFGTSRQITFPGIRTLDFAEMEILAGKMAYGLASLGLRKGDRVLLHLPNCWQWIIAYHAIARLGCVVIPANILNSAAEIAFMVADSGAKAAFVPDDRTDRIVAPVIAITPGEVTGAIAFDSLMSAEWLPPAEISPDDLFTIGYTSGTTGQPKGAMLSHGSIFASIEMTATIHVRNPADHVYSALPFPHVYGNVVMNCCFLAGTELTAPARFDPGETLRAIGERRITLLEGVPTMYYQMLADPELEAADFRTLTRCTVGGQTIPIAKLEAIRSRFGCPVLELWGMTEVGGPATSHSPWWPPRLGTIGMPFPGLEARIAAPGSADAEAATGEPGELMVRGKQVMQGYWNNPKATTLAIDPQGWLATGDIAVQDPDGYLTIVDRKKDMILTAGYNVYPAELEQAIAQHPAVAMVAVAGEPDDEKGEIAVAYVVTFPDARCDAEALISHCRSRLAAYKIPRRIEFTDDLPKTSTGKIMRRALGETHARSQP